MFFVDRKGPPHKQVDVNLPIYRDCFGDLFLPFLLQLKAMEKEKNNFFFFLKKVTKVLVIRKYRPINRRFILHKTSWPQAKKNRMKKKKEVQNGEYGIYIFTHLNQYVKTIRTQLKIGRNSLVVWRTYPKKLKLLVLLIIISLMVMKR